MNFSFIKNIYENIPYTFKAPFSRFIRNRLIKNQLFISTYDMLNDSDNWSIEKKEEKQLELLKETLVHAYEHTIYYKELFDSIGFSPYDFSSFNQLENIPVLTKDILQDRFEDMISDDPDYGYLVKTGGTSGEPTKIIMANEAFFIEWAYVYNFWKKYGYDYSKSKLATFRGIKLGNKLYEINPMYNEIRMNVFLMGKGVIEKYILAIKKYKADFIYGYPSAIYNFCKLAEECDLRVDNLFKGVFLISENLYPFQEEMIKKTLNCPIGMFYGHTERAVFAERIEEGYKFNPLYGYVQIDDERPIVTGFINKKTPLIRYLVDDRVIEDNGKYHIEGHHDGEVLYGEDGEEISAASINFHDGTFENVYGYQFVQQKKGSCTLLIKPKKQLNSTEIEMIKFSVDGKLGKTLKCDVKVTDDLIMSKRGKYRMIIHIDG